MLLCHTSTNSWTFIQNVILQFKRATSLCFMNPTCIWSWPLFQVSRLNFSVNFIMKLGARVSVKMIFYVKQNLLFSQSFMRCLWLFYVCSMVIIIVSYLWAQQKCGCLSTFFFLTHHHGSRCEDQGRFIYKPWIKRLSVKWNQKSYYFSIYFLKFTGHKKFF